MAEAPGTSQGKGGSARPVAGSAGHPLARAVLESIPRAAVLTDEEDRIRLLNPAAESLFGFATREVYGRPSDVLRANDAASPAFENGPHREEAGRLVTYESRDGSVFLGRTETSPLHDPSGTMLGSITLVRDVTVEWRRREAFDRMLEASPVGVVVTDQHGHVAFWNGAAERIFGWREEEVLGRPVPFVPEGQGDEHRRLVEQALSGERLTGIELRRVRKDGAPVDVRLHTAPIRGPDGQPRSILALLEDITEWKAQDRERRRLASFPGQNPNPVIEVDGEGAVTYQNPRAFQDLGDQLGEVLPDPLRTPLEPYLRALQRGRPTEGLLEPIRTSNRVYEGKAHTLPEDDRVRLYLHDVTERERSVDKFRAVFHRSNDAIVLHDLEGNVLEVNERACQLFEYEAGELESMHVQELHPSDTHKQVQRRVQEVREDGHTSFQIPMVRADGTTFLAEISARSFQLGNRRISQAIVRDVTGRI